MPKPVPERSYTRGVRAPDKPGQFKNFAQLFMPRKTLSIRTSDTSDDKDWLNSLMEYIWPHMSVVMQNTMDKEVEPAIREAVPQIKDSFEIYTVMGEIPPTLGPLMTFCDDDECDSISIEVGISWEADMYIQVDASILSVKIDHIKVNGTLVIRMSPLIDEIPLVGAMHIYFLDPPDIDFRVRVKNSPIPLTNKIHSIANKAVQDAVVLPNRIMAPVAFLHQLPSLRLLHNPEPAGVLRLTVMEMRNLPIADYSLIGAGSSDPFAEVDLGAQNWSSDVVYSNLNPVWTEGNVKDFFFYTHHQNVRFKVWDYDLTSGNDELGDVHGLTVMALEGEHWFDMEVSPEFSNTEEDEHGGHKKQCYICSQDWIEEEKTPEERESIATAHAAEKAQVRLLGKILNLREDVALSQNSENVMEIAVTGIRGANGCKEKCDGLLCSVTFEDEERWTTPSVINEYVEPVFLENKIDPAVVYRLGQIHTPEKVADIMEITTQQVEACLRSGFPAIWCHSFFYMTKAQSGDILFKVGEYEATLSFQKPLSSCGWEKTFNNFRIGPFILEVTIRLNGLCDKPKKRRTGGNC